MDTKYWAHVDGEGETLRSHALVEHLRDVGRLAEDFASVFGSGGWAEAAGRWHDLGKFRAGFQHKLRVAGGVDAHIENVGLRVTHSTAGAIHAVQALGKAQGSVLAFLIAGHHAGLPDMHSSDGGAGSLAERLAGEIGQVEVREALSEAIPPEVLAAPANLSEPLGGKEGFALWIRMLFSCLVDADFLDTEAFFDTTRARARESYPNLLEIKQQLDASLAIKSDRARQGGISEVNGLRAQVLTQCHDKGADHNLKPGFFSLTVPTGGGKTLSSLAFAPEHAIAHGHRRIIYAIPFTSIIEQTAQVFREALSSLGADVVIEHHSNLDVREGSENHASRLASENWDAPLIVTTNVQLFESLHASRTSRCRKLHNLANSVIVLDEAQQLPREFLAPVLRVLKQLVEHYGVSVVFCTATQPALQPRLGPFGRRVLDGIPDEQVRSIIEDSAPLFDAMRRVDVHFPESLKVTTPWDEVARRIEQHECVLAIVNTRRHARDLAAMLPAEGTEHLSALMCAQHRSDVIARIRKRLAVRAEGRDTTPLRVISTQLVEAGVDLDFPVVYRALAGLDAIAQAAGRCNREGSLPGRGEVHVFVPEGGVPPGLMGQGAEAAREMAALGLLDDPLAPETFRAYFDRYYARESSGFDKHAILEMLSPQRLAFRTAAEAFRLIDEAGETIVVPYCQPGQEEGPVEMWLNTLRTDPAATWARRKLQRYTVTVPQGVFKRLHDQKDVEERAGLWVASPSRYDDERYGLLLPEDHGGWLGV